MSLLSKVKKRLQEQREKGKQEKRERKIIEKEAQAKAHQEYLTRYKFERTSQLKAQARRRAKKDAVGGSGIAGLNLGNVGSMLGKAGKNFLDSDQLDLGIGPTKKGKKKKEFNPWTM